MQNLADADEIILSKDVYDTASVKQLVAPFSVVPQNASLRGVHEDTPVYRVQGDISA